MALEDIFRAYDVRGRVNDELTPDVMEAIGHAYAADLNKGTIVVGHDVRESSPDLCQAFVRGITSAGIDVFDCGLAPYGATLFYSWQKVLPSAFVTASHLPQGWNGIKFAHGNGIGFTEQENMRIRNRFFDGHRASSGQSGSVQTVNVLDQYTDHLRSNVDVGRVRVLMDCGNGAASVVAPDLFRAAGVDVDVMHGEPDGTFPNRESDVTEESLEHLRERVAAADYDMGVAYDGDADRVAVIDDDGRLLDAEQLAAILLQDVFEREEGPVVANVECSRMLEHIADQYDRDVVRVRVGHTYLFKAIQKYDACLGVEKSGHMGIPHVLPLDDGVAASLYAAEVVSKLDNSLSDAVQLLPDYVRGRFSFNVPDSEKFAVVRNLQERLSREYQRTNTMDGIRVDMDDGWILARASNTSPKIRLTVEADDVGAYEKLDVEFTRIIEDAIEDHMNRVTAETDED